MLYNGVLCFGWRSHSVLLLAQKEKDFPFPRDCKRERENAVVNKTKQKKVSSGEREYYIPRSPPPPPPLKYYPQLQPEQNVQFEKKSSKFLQRRFEKYNKTGSIVCWLVRSGTPNKTNLELTPRKITEPLINLFFMTRKISPDFRVWRIRRDNFNFRHTQVWGFFPSSAVFLSRFYYVLCNWWMHSSSLHPLPEQRKVFYIT